MNLKEWIAKEGITIQELADRVPVSRPYMSRLVAGDVHPSLAVALDTRAATRGEVPLEYMLPRALRPRPKAAPKKPGTARKPAGPSVSRPPAAA